MTTAQPQNGAVLGRRVPGATLRGAVAFAVAPDVDLLRRVSAGLGALPEEAPPWVREMADLGLEHPEWLIWPRSPRDWRATHWREEVEAVTAPSADELGHLLAELASGQPLSMVSRPPRAAADQAGDPEPPREPAVPAGQPEPRPGDPGTAGASKRGRVTPLQQRPWGRPPSTAPRRSA